MKQITVLFLYFFLVIFFANKINSQDLTLSLLSKNKTENEFLQQLNFIKTHKDSVSLTYEVKKIATHLKDIGYFSNNIDSIHFTNKKTVAYFSLNRKINHAKITFPKKNINLKDLLKTKNNTYNIPVSELQPLLKKITNKKELQGHSFSKVQLQNINLKADTLFADLYIYESKKRKINNIVIKGYKDFPKSFIKNYYKINKETIFNQKKLKEISTTTKQLPFIKEIKPPEVLFTKDSTSVYIYIKKEKNNSFEGIVNFTSNEKGSLLLNGHLDLKLNNILNTGEDFEVFWNSINKQSQEFKISTKLPYILNTSFSPSISFSLYKQDSTFLNTKLDTKLYYAINSKIRLATTYSSENSENLLENLENNIVSYRNYFLGFEFEYSLPKVDNSFEKKFLIRINPSFGKRTISNSSSKQYKIEATISYIWDLNLKNSIYLRNNTGHLNSDNIINNELFRLGGANSIRGFNEQSILAKEYSYFNIEYRYLTSEKSYLYSITDIGTVDNNSFIGLGLGYLFNIKNSFIKLSIVSGKAAVKKTSLKDTKLIINFLSYF